MKYYLVQVRYLQAGEPKSVIHKEYAESAAGAAAYVAEQLALCQYVTLNINEHDRFIINRDLILNMTVVAG